MMEVFVSTRQNRESTQTSSVNLSQQLEHKQIPKGANQLEYKNT